MTQPTIVSSSPAPSGWTLERRVQFLHCLAEKGNVRRACAQVGLSRQGAYKLRARNPEFARIWDAALMAARDARIERLLAALPGTTRRIPPEPSNGAASRGSQLPRGPAPIWRVFAKSEGHTRSVDYCENVHKTKLLWPRLTLSQPPFRVNPAWLSPSAMGLRDRSGCRPAQGSPSPLMGEGSPLNIRGWPSPRDTPRGRTPRTRGRCRTACIHRTARSPTRRGS
jgi:hypothetical protein